MYGFYMHMYMDRGRCVEVKTYVHKYKHKFAHDMSVCAYIYIYIYMDMCVYAHMQILKLFTCASRMSEHT